MTAREPRRKVRTRGLVLAPGAGAGREQSGLVAIDDAVTSLGITVERLDFPYRLAGRRAPDRPPVLLRAIVEAVEQLAEKLGVKTGSIAVGGRSMGGRIASMAVAEGLEVSRLVCVSYPLHPPGHPEKPRTAHLGEIAVPSLFVSGSRDAFGTPEELEAAIAAVPGPPTLVVLDGGDHGLRRKETEAAIVVRDWISS